MAHHNGRRSVVRFDSLQTPIGRVFVAVSDRGVCDVTLGETHESRYRQHLASRTVEVLHGREAVEPVLAEIEEYFAGTRTQFSVPIDLRVVTPFAGQVLRKTTRIPFGRVRSYGEIARQMHAPRASRAVGGALSRNPVPILVPCHRVVAHDGRLGGFTGGVQAKRALLRVEGVTTDDRCRVAV